MWRWQKKKSTIVVLTECVWVFLIIIYKVVKNCKIFYNFCILNDAWIWIVQYERKVIFSNQITKTYLIMVKYTVIPMDIRIPRYFRIEFWNGWNHAKLIIHYLFTQICLFYCNTYVFQIDLILMWPWPSHKFVLYITCNFFVVGNI